MSLPRQRGGFSTASANKEPWVFGGTTSLGLVEHFSTILNIYNAVFTGRKFRMVEECLGGLGKGELDKH